MRNQPDFTDEFRAALESHQPSADLDRIERRVCGSDDFDGAEYSFYGWYVPIRPIIDEVAQLENFAIESLAYIDESSDDNDFEPHLNIFLADLRKQQAHPAFTEV